MDQGTEWEIIRAHQARWPVPVVRLARALGVEVYDADGWPNNISGRIYRSEENGGESGYAIDVNEDHPLTRQRFTVAHEIGHFMLHRDRIGDELYDDGLYRSGLPSAMETQANQMAAEILMPKKLITRAMTQGIKDPAVLAQMFKVSEASMRIRLGIAG